MLDLTQDLHEVARLVSAEHDLEEVLDRALAALRELVPYDLAAVYRLDGDTLRVVAAAGPLDAPAVRQHSLHLDRFPTIRRALETRRPIPLEAHHHAGEEGDPYDGLLDLPDGHSCMVVPLFSGERSLGLITLDRTRCAVYAPEAVQMAGVYGQLVSMAIRFADQAALLDRYRRQLEAQTRQLRADAGGGSQACSRIQASRSPAMRQVARLAQQVAPTDLPVLIEGETGTGKEVLAEAIHEWSARARAPFVRLNCAALPQELVESELFGHVQGAFSGAVRDRRGRFQTANGGTLLLDEVGDLPLPAQAKLLRVLQEGSFEPVGSDRPVRVDVRILAATHVDLKAAVAAGRFREDLYYRLAVFPLALPPLRERGEDAVLIAEELLAELARDRRRGPWTLSGAAAAALASAPWPGNVRQLRNAVERATILQPRGELSAQHLGLERRAPPPAPPEAPAGRPPTFQENERRYMEALLRHTGGRIAGPGGAAELSGLKVSTLRSRMEKLGVALHRRDAR